MANLLRTDYKDDILNTEVNTQRKYRMVTNDDGTVSFVDVTDYAQVGDSFGGADINKTNEAVNGLNNALTVRYNKETDYIQVYSNGEWVNFAKATAILCEVTPISVSGIKYHEWANNVYTYSVTFQSGKYKKLAVNAEIVMQVYAQMIISYYDESTNEWVELYNKTNSATYPNTCNVSSNETYSLPETASELKVQFIETYGGGSFNISKFKLFTTDATIEPTESKSFAVS